MVVNKCCEKERLKMREHAHLKVRLACTTPSECVTRDCPRVFLPQKRFVDPEMVILSPSTKWGCRMSHRKWNNWLKGPHWPVQPVRPIIPFPMQYSVSPPVTTNLSKGIKSSAIPLLEVIDMSVY